MSWPLSTVLQWTLRCMYLFELWSSLDICPGVGLLGHMVTLFSVFKGNSELVSIVAVLIYIPTNSIGGFSFHHTLCSIHCRVFDDGHSDLGFPSGSAGKESTCNVGGLSSIPGLGRSPGEGKGYPLQYSRLENYMDCIVHGVTKSRTLLSNFPFCFHSDQREVVACNIDSFL